MSVKQPTFGTRELYDSLAESLNSDPTWLVKAKAMTFSMAHVYRYPDDTQRTFRMEFRTGKICDVTEFDDPADLPETAFVLRGSSDDWRDMLVTEELSVNVAMVTRRILVKGKMGTLMKNIPQFNYIVRRLIELDPVVPGDEPG
ncbi:hypothetical protein [Sporichthya sp.]|uniref:SCP2 sterol-binding domain-containing protein n=1 Tax=Sporichthya sp. TaxID=65475 RepID=UPI0017FDBFF7|nr:hypothetical protein [Sporichthya sp.]MBA3742959.1 hypothetical protein [Sporichthya sp.]